MREWVRRTLVAGTMIALAAGSVLAIDGVSISDRAPCDKHEVSGAGVDPEEKVASWLVDRLLDVDAYADPVIDLETDEVSRATGVDVEAIDLDEVKGRVHAKLRDLERWGIVDVRPVDKRGAQDSTTNAGSIDERAGSGSAAGRGATAASPGGSRSMN